MTKENKCYVYLHRYVENGEVFYVGKGTAKRSNTRSGRSKEWTKASLLGEYYTEIVASNLSSTEAQEVEKEFFDKHLATIVNKISPFKVAKLEYSFVSGLFEYSKNSPSCLMWKKDANLLNQGIRRVRGKKAGYCQSGYWKVKLLGKSLQVHRILYCLYNKTDLDPDKLIDHIDGNPSNNVESNLKLSTYAQNARNKKNGNKRTNEETGQVGVIRFKYKGLEYYMAQHRTLDGKNRSKSFNIAKLGESEAFRLACNWRSTQIALLNDQGAGYTSRHGQ